MRGRVEFEGVSLGGETAAELDWRRGRVDRVVIRGRRGHGERYWETGSEKRGGGGTREGSKVREEDGSDFILDFGTARIERRRRVSQLLGSSKQEEEKTELTFPSNDLRSQPSPPATSSKRPSLPPT